MSERNAKIVWMRAKGCTYRFLGEMFGITPARVRQIVLREEKRRAETRLLELYPDDGYLRLEARGEKLSISINDALDGWGACSLTAKGAQALRDAIDRWLAAPVSARPAPAACGDRALCD